MRHELMQTALGLALVFWPADVRAVGPGTSHGHARGLGSPSTVVLGDLTEAQPEELAQRPATHRPRNNFRDEHWNRRGELTRGRRGSPNAAGLTPNSIGAPALRDAGSRVLTPTATLSFRGLAEKNNNALTPSDMGLAVGPSFVLQVVNGQIAVYDKTSVLQSGFPKNLNSFFSLPPATPSGDPRALYDWVNNRFIVIMMAQDVANSRGFIFLAVTQTNDPRGAWNIYFARAGETPSGVCPDFPTLGQDRQGIYIADNLFSCSGGEFGNFLEAEVILVPKGPVYAGQPVTVWVQEGDFISQNEEVDSIQPANVMNVADKPRAEFMVASYNINYGGGQCLNGCTGLVVFAVSNPFGFLTGGPPPEVSEFDLPTDTTYFLSLGAHQPGSEFSVDTGDTRITGSVVYSAGSLFASVNTGCIPQCDPASGLEETQPVWWEIGVTLNDNDNDDLNCTGSFENACPQIESAFRRQEQCFGCGGRPNNGSAYYATLQPDGANNVTMVFNYSDSSSIFPGTFYASRRVTQAQNTMHDGGSVLVAGLALYDPINQRRWGDYTGTAVDFSNPKATALWFSGMFVKSNGFWGTQIGTNKFSSVTDP
jgi:hypothetical protein